MSARQMKTQGFTLVEILIVVVILGILAAIVIPQFTSASETAKASSLVSQLQTIRSQLELYQVQHSGDYPLVDIDTSDTDGEWTALTMKTDVLGSSAGTDDFGAYLQKAPKNSFSAGVGTTIATDNSADWQYTAATGAILAVIPSGKWDQLVELGLGTTADEAGTSNSDVVKGP